MLVATVAILAALIASIAYLRCYRSDQAARRPGGGWYGLALLALLLAGLWVSGRAGNEAAAYGFGFAIALVLFVMGLAGVASALGRAMRKRKGQPL